MSSRLALLSLLIAAHVSAAPTTLRFGALAPEGTSWARALRGFAADVQSSTQGQVQIKLYFGGIAGDELTQADRVRRGQLDGIAAASLCERLAPSVRVTRLIGLFQGRHELKYVVSKLRSRIDAEMAKSGFVALGFATFGASILLSRTPVSSMEQLRKTRLWAWNQDDVLLRALRRMGVPVVEGDISDAARWYAEGKVDGFIRFPIAALAYQWSTQARWFTELPFGFLSACLVVSQRAFDAVPIPEQNAVRAAAAKLAILFDDAGVVQDQALLGGLFDKQGMKRAPVSQAFRNQFFEEALHARDAIAPEVATPALLGSVLTWLADFRAEHAGPPAR